MRKTRNMVIGLPLVLAAVLLVSWIGNDQGHARAQAPRTVPQPRPPAAVSAQDLIVVLLKGDEKSELLTVIDASKRVMSVYRIDRATGKITLCSVRGISWDLQMTEFNGESPLPREIRSLIQPR